MQLLGDWNGKEKRTPLSFCALRPDLAAMRFDDMPGDGQAQPRPSARSGFVHPVEALEDARDLVRGDAHPCILYSKAYLARQRLRAKQDIASRSRELDRVMDEVDQYLFQPL